MAKRAADDTYPGEITKKLKSAEEEPLERPEPVTIWHVFKDTINYHMANGETSTELCSSWWTYAQAKEAAQAEIYGEPESDDDDYNDGLFYAITEIGEGDREKVYVQKGKVRGIPLPPGTVEKDPSPERSRWDKDTEDDTEDEANTGTDEEDLEVSDDEDSKRR